MEDTKLMRLPWEMVFQVMTSFLPRNARALIPTSHDGTQLLIDFSLVCRATHELAVRNMRQHCVYLDSEARLRRFLLSIEASRASHVNLPSVFNEINTIYLAPFKDSMDNLPTAQWIRELLYYTCGSLKRLIANLPFDSLPPWDDHLNVGVVLREGFAQLVNLEEFVCSRDEIHFGLTGDQEFITVGAEVEPLVHHLWPSLRRLAVTLPPSSRNFWTYLLQFPSLDNLIHSTPLCFGLDAYIMGDFLLKIPQDMTVVVPDHGSTRSKRMLIWVPPAGSEGMRIVVHDSPDDGISILNRELQGAEWLLDN
ncbi:hypothetical protein F4778DRAFT_442976 [Xylariomycetidae sp. FL2044]|nr:hypothetical protein F4778DRAFT_442976 [Xylariomycetidae sp. FL2044]